LKFKAKRYPFFHKHIPIKRLEYALLYSLALNIFDQNKIINYFETGNHYELYAMKTINDDQYYYPIDTK